MQEIFKRESPWREEKGTGGKPHGQGESRESTITKKDDENK